jgi:signal transduction histidine kinase
VRSTLSRRVVGATVVLGVLIGAAFLLVLGAIRDERDESRMARAARAELGRTAALESILLHLDGHARAFAFTGADQHRQRAVELEAELEQAIAGLDPALLSPPSSQRVDEIVADVRDYVASVSRPMLATPLADRDELAGVLDAADRRRADLQQRIDEHRAAENRTMAVRQQGSDAATRRGVILASLGIGGSICVMILFAALLVRWVLGPLRRASAMADRIAGGDLTVRLPTDGVGEIGRLERSFNEMAQSLAVARRANLEALDQLQASRARVVAAGDEARRRIERDLHDGIQQRLVSLALRLRTLEADAESATAARLATTSAELSETISELQEVARGIHPAILTQGGLAPALRTLARRSPVEVRVDVGEPRRLPDAVEVALYYVASEALTNAAKHAACELVEITLQLDEREAVLTVADDGRGGARVGAGSGMLGMTDRVGAVGGTVEIESDTGTGTRVTAAVPLGDTTRR